MSKDFLWCWSIGCQGLLPQKEEIKKRTGLIFSSWRHFASQLKNGEYETSVFQLLQMLCLCSWTHTQIKINGTPSPFKIAPRPWGARSLLSLSCKSWLSCCLSMHLWRSCLVSPTFMLYWTASNTPLSLCCVLLSLGWTAVWWRVRLGLKCTGTLYLEIIPLNVSDTPATNEMTMFLHLSLSLFCSLAYLLDVFADLTKAHLREPQVWRAFFDVVLFLFLPFYPHEDMLCPIV